MSVHCQALVLAGVVALAALPGRLHSQPGHILSNPELRALFAHDQRIRTLPLSTQRREYFFSDGSYRFCGDRSGATGVYRITGDQVCVTDQLAKSCRRLTRLGPGRYLQVIKYKNEPRPRRMEVEIVGADRREGCA